MKRSIGDLCNIQYIYIILWCGVFFAISFITLLVFKPGLLPYPLIAIFICMNIPITQRIIEIIFSIWGNPLDLPKINMLNNALPKVALLYCTCDDLVIDCLQSLANQTYPNCKIFILDDSEGQEIQLRIDSLGFETLRRGSRAGFKAGNINNWLRAKGGEFEYFVIADADSWLPDDFVEKALLYAEHPENANISLFESKILPRASETRISKNLSFYSRLSLYIDERIGNNLGIKISAGHNNLCRTRDLLEINGFDEQYISEDHATTLNFLKNGNYCRQIDFHTFEGVPNDVVTFAKRSSRWARSDIQLLSHNWLHVPLILQIHLFTKITTHLLRVPYLIGLIHVTFV